MIVCLSNLGLERLSSQYLTTKKFPYLSLYWMSPAFLKDARCIALKHLIVSKDLGMFLLAEI